MRRILLVLIVSIALLLTVVLLNTVRFTSRQVQIEAVEIPDVNAASAARNLSQALRFQTHQENGQIKAEEFLALHSYLASTFPGVHSELRREVIGDYSLLYQWHGRDDALKPILLAAHLDVVPVEPGTEAAWRQPAFGGRIADGFIWGRGAMDNKAGVLGVLEAAEQLLAGGFQPERTVYLAFGHDEETGGSGGAARIAELLRERGVELEFVLDEGLVISDGIVPVPLPVALIGIAEKGSVSLELTVDSEGGHSSMPPPHTAIGILSTAVSRVEEHRMPGRLAGVLRQMFDYIGPEMPFGERLVLANLWLFRPLVERQLSASPSTDAALRTTAAATLIAGGVKENVLPARASAVVNFRILPGDRIEEIIARVRAVVDDPRVGISRYGERAWEPSRISATEVTGFKVIERTIRQVFPDVAVAPALVLGATDSRHYASLTDDIYRFLPQRYGPEDVKRIHGVNERISVENYTQSVRFYYQLLRNSAR